MKTDLALDASGPSDLPVGRRSEMRALEAWTSEAWDGQLRIVTVAGDAGIGKSTVVDAMVARWRADGAEIRSAVCHEDFAVPYLPILTALRARDHGMVEATRRAQLIDRTPEPFVSVTEELLLEASHRRVVLCIDDLHWADVATLDLLVHIVTTAARQTLLEPVTLLVVLSFRRPGRDDPLGRIVERVRRERAHRDLTLGPLDELAVNQLLLRLLKHRPSRQLLAEVVEVTEGNPLFVRNLVEHLGASGALSVEQGEMVAAGEVAADHAELDTVLQARIGQLSDPARHVLTVVAHLGDGQAVEVLQCLVDLDDVDLERSLDELETAGLLVERPDGSFEFRHGLIRQLLARGLSTRARRGLHLRIATTLIDLTPEPDDDRILRIAHHLRHAGPKAPPELLFDYAGRAASRCIELGAWAEAARYAEAALAAVPGLTPSDDLQEVVVDLRLTAALAHFRNHDATATARHAAQVIDHAKRAGDTDAWGRALLLAHRSDLTLSPEVTTDATRHADLEHYLAAAGDASPDLRARCWQLLAEIHVSAGNLERADDANDRARRLADEAGDDVLRAEAEFADGLARFAALRPDDAIEALEASAASARAGGDDWILAWPLGRLGLTRVMQADLRGADQDVRVAIALDRRTHHWAEEGLARAGEALVGLARNDLFGCERAAEDAIALYERSSYPYTASIAWPVQAYARALRLDRLGAHATIGVWQASGVRGASRFGILVDALTLPDEEFTASIDRARYQPASVASPHAYTAGGLAIDIEVGTRLGDTDLLQAALDRLDTLADRGVVLLLPVGASVDRLRAMAHIGLGDRARGIDLLDATTTKLRDAGATVERLHCDLERTIALGASHDPAAEAAAIATARALDEASLLALLQRLRERLPAEISTGTRLRRTVVVWDMVDSTQHLVAVGDEAYVDLVHQLNELIHRHLAEHRGFAFKYTGDGVFAWFLDHADAVRCALAVRDDLARRHRRSPDDPLRLRTGVATGQPVDHAGDLFGVAVVTAARLCADADDGQVLCTADSVADLGDRVLLERVGTRALKGLGTPVEVVALART